MITGRTAGVATRINELTDANALALLQSSRLRSVIVESPQVSAMLNPNDVTTARTIETDMLHHTVSSASNRETTGNIDPVMERAFLSDWVYTVAVR
jgi:hypothetical protein